MPRELTDAAITFVSYVDKGANQKKFFMTKAAKMDPVTTLNPTFEKQVKILTKVDDAEQLVYGVVYEPDVVDVHGDFMTAPEIEKAAHGFLKDARNIDTQHDFNSGVGEVVESYVAPADFTIGEETITKGSWVLVTKASTEIWEQIQKGDITGYSMAGTAIATEVEKAHDAEMKGFFQTLKQFFTGESVQKGEVKDKFHAERQKREFIDAFWIFDHIFWDELWSNSPDVQRIKDAAIDFGELLTDLANSPDILKAIGPIEKGAVITVKKEDFQALLKEELAPLSERITALEKEAGEPEGQEPDATPEGQEPEGEDLAKSLREVLKEALAPLNERLETVEKARGLSKAQEGEEGEDVQKSEGSVFGSLFSR